jgi:broad specificity phosphatase PhoE
VLPGAAPQRSSPTAPLSIARASMCRLIVVRHGESEANRARRFAVSGEVPLTDLGRQQAQALACELAAARGASPAPAAPRQVVTSVFRRAAETGEILAAHLGLPLATAPGIEERDLGDLKGEPYEALGAMARQDPAFDPARRWLWRPPGGESLEEVRQRVVAALGALAARHAGDTLLVVSHGAVMLSLWAHVTGSWDGAPLPVNCALLPLDCAADGTLSHAAPAPPAAATAPPSPAAGRPA